MSRGRARIAVLGAAWFFASLAGCAGSRPLPPPEQPVEVDAAALSGFVARIDSFYQLLPGRRFNTLDTFHDPALRGYFRSEDRFFDYYADLSQGLELAHFAKSRPDLARVVEFVFDASDRARVQVVLRGEDGRPLRPDTTDLIRIDRWEWAEENWWIAPEKL